MSNVSGGFQVAGAILAIWGMGWTLWDHNADAPGYLIGASLVSLLIGLTLN